MELVRAASMAGYFAVAEELGLDANRLMRSSGLTRSMIANPEQMLPARSVIHLLEESARLSGCLTFGFRMAEKRHVSDLGMLSLLIVHQSTLREGLQVLSDYRHRINSNLTLQVEEHGDTAFLREAFTLDPPMLSRQVHDLALGVLYQLCASLMGDDWRPLAICLTYEQPPMPDRAVYERLFHCPIQFGADFDGIVIDSRDLDRRNPRADDALASHARQLVGAMIDPGHRSIAEEVEQSIRLLMPAGRASIGGVADALGMHVRTLQRKLEQEGVRFSTLIERVRVHQVTQHFGNRRLRLTDVAQLLGYSSLSSFSAWYRQQFGESPRNGRARMEAESARSARLLPP